MNSRNNGGTNKEVRSKSQLASYYVPDKLPVVTTHK